MSLKDRAAKPPPGLTSEWSPRCGNQMLLVIYFHPKMLLIDVSI